MRVNSLPRHAPLRRKSGTPRRLTCLESLETRVLLSAFGPGNMNGPWTVAGPSAEGSIQFDSANNITGGTLTDSAGNITTPAGNYAINLDGTLSMNLSAVASTGAMNSMRDTIAMSDTSVIDTLSVLVSGGAATFSNADLNGSWTLAFNDNHDTKSGGGTVIFDGLGNVTGGSTATGAAKASITGGSYTVNADGTCSVTLIINKKLTESFSGALNASKDTLAVSPTSIATANANLKPNFALMVRSQGAYSKADAHGNWTLETALGHGIIAFSGGGNIDPSTFTSWDGANSTISGSYSIAGNGNITVNVIQNRNGTILNFTLTGAMNAGRNLIVMDSTLDTGIGNVAVLTSGADHAPTLTAMKPFATATGGLPFTLTYSQLQANATGLADIDGDPLQFQVDAPAAGATIQLNGVPQNSFPFNVASGDTVTFTPAPAATGKVSAFSVRAFDGILTSATDIPVMITTNPEPTVSVTTATSIATEVNNGDKGVGGITFSRKGETTSSLTVLYNVTGAANDGVNYNVLSGTAIIPIGKSSVTVPVVPLDNITREGNISVTLTIAANGPHYIIGAKTSGVVTIVDNNLAPLSVAGKSLSATITAGTAPFASSGTYQLFFNAGNNSFALVGGPTVASVLGTYSYTRTSATTATLNLTSAQTGTSNGTITFTSATAAVFTFAQQVGSGSQSSKVTLVAAPTTNFAPASIAGRVDTHKITSGTGSLAATGTDQAIFAESSNLLVIAGVAPVHSTVNNYTYSKFGPNLGIVTFTNAASINGFTIVLYTSATAATYATMLDSGGGTQHGTLTVAPTPLVTLAPVSLSGKTLNNTITGGAAPFAVHGASTMILSAATYTFTQTIPVANSSGTYTYEVLTPTIGYISYNDSIDGPSFAVLSFTTVTKASYVLAKIGTAGWERGTTSLI